MTPHPHKVARASGSASPSRNLTVLLGVVSGAVVGITLLVLWPRQEVTRRGPPAPPIPMLRALPSATAHGSATGAGATTSAAHRPPRTARTPDKPPPALELLTTRYDWPPEPAAPAQIDDQRFTESLAQICNVGADSDVRSWYAGWITTYARTFGTDPFLLGGLMAARSRCDPHRPSPWLGLTGLVAELYEPDIRDRRYHYRAFIDDRWQERSLLIDRFPFDRRFASAPESNLYFAAAFLKAYQERQRGLFVSFAHSDYRHYVSHFVWGDHVRGNRQEDQILAERRRLLEYYGARPPAPPVVWRGVTLGCPLDGCPRVITSTLGDSRAGGTRAHRGVDFESTEGEPVRAVADGKVLFAGADLPGSAHQGLPIYAQRSVAGSLFGAGGIYVCLEHTGGRARGSLISCYMHMQTSMVDPGRLLKRGDQIGRVGKTGIKESAPHLHFELHADGEVLSAASVLRGLVLGTPRNTPLPGE